MELKLIEQIKRTCEKLDRENLYEFIVKGIGDDCAELASPSGRNLIITTDTMVEGTHFKLSYFSPGFLARKLVSVNVSDIAAMGGVPFAALLNLEVPSHLKDLDSPFWEEFKKGLFSQLTNFGIRLIGGDTVSLKNERLGLTLTLLGFIEKERAVYRSGAKEGDYIYVSGYVGEAGAGLKILENRSYKRHLLPRPVKRHLILRHLDPTPRLKLGRLLSGLGVNAMIDVSDGISTDLSHIARESGLCARIFAKDIPISRPLLLFSKMTKKSALDLALFSGEDFELMWTISPERAREMEKRAAKVIGRRPFFIGNMERGEGVVLERDGKEMDITFKGYEH